jgi:hypothetical protein
MIPALLRDRVFRRYWSASTVSMFGDQICLPFTAPLVLWPLARGGAALAMLFAAEFASGFGVMVLDISIGAIFAAVIPDTLRSRVSGAFQAVNYGTRPLGRCSAGAGHGRRCTPRRTVHRDPDPPR